MFDNYFLIVTFTIFLFIEINFAQLLAFFRVYSQNVLFFSLRLLYILVCSFVFV